MQNFSGSRNATDIVDAKACPAETGTELGYSIEARHNYTEPRKIGGKIYDNRWREVPHWDAPHGYGIPKPRYESFSRQASRLLSRSEAEALRWWFICGAQAEPGPSGAICLETRIVEHKVKYEYSVTPVRYLDAFDMRGDLPDDMTPEIDN